MQTKRRAERDARDLFRLCLIDRSLDEARVRHVVQQVIAAGRPNGLHVLPRFLRRVRLDIEKHRAEVTSAAPLPASVRADIEAGLTRLYGPDLDLATSFADDPTLIAGVRIRVGSDVYDGSVKGNLAALESRF